MRLDELPPTEAGMHRAQGRIIFTVNDHYFRALVKIAFHYYLTRTRRGMRGDEPAFMVLRRFIIDGGHHENFFHRSRTTFAVPFGELPNGGAVTPSQWCHILAADETCEVVVVYVHLFVGPGCVSHPHYVTLGPLDSQIVLANGVWGHVYMYDRVQPPTGLAGRVIPATFTRLR
jgi:hypothetical protein